MSGVRRNLILDDRTRFKRLERPGKMQNRELYLVVFIDLNAITILRYFTRQLLYSKVVIRV